MEVFMKIFTLKSLRSATLFVAAVNLITFGSAIGLAAQPAPQEENQYVRGVPQCGQSQYDNRGNFYLINTCNIKVTITFTSNGIAWGTTSVAPGERQLTETIGLADQRSNGVISIYTCPGDSNPVLPNGQPFPGHNYRGPIPVTPDLAFQRTESEMAQTRSERATSEVLPL
jgi:hypothetical protein